MAELARIEQQLITTDDVVKSLQFGGRFTSLLEDVVRDKLVVHAAKKAGITVSEDEVQTRADQLRRIIGLHRASDMLNYLERLHVTVDDFEQYVTEMLLHEKKEKEITGDAQVEEYFRLNSPKFDGVELAHIIVRSEGAAHELIAILEDEPERFGELAREHSTADTKSNDGVIGRVTRGALESDVEAKIFNSEVEEALGPYESADGESYEIDMVVSKHPAELDEPTRRMVKKQLFDDWVAATARETDVELL